MYFPQQPQQPQQQQQAQQAQQQPQVAVSPVMTPPQSASVQARDSGSARKARSSALRIVWNNRDVLTGEEVAPTVATPTATQAPDLPSTPVVTRVVTATTSSLAQVEETQLCKPKQAAAESARAAAQV